MRPTLEILESRDYLTAVFPDEPIDPVPWPNPLVDPMPEQPADQSGDSLGGGAGQDSMDGGL